ncbi:hypothetical protein QAD02_010435 [Eretmocerus hayati]|uniref:Uncharacterized protein n=1 Tax=Eretmocerus hayati TaxID=131215 RepID=A0ACC2NTT8_9HYME|nr:hypothetical protein QAD02_010435 [Eretmocerus hayati]
MTKRKAKESKSSSVEATRKKESDVWMRSSSGATFWNVDSWSLKKRQPGETRLSPIFTRWSRKWCMNLDYDAPGEPLKLSLQLLTRPPTPFKVRVRYGFSNWKNLDADPAMSMTAPYDHLFDENHDEEIAVCKHTIWENFDCISCEISTMKNPDAVLNCSPENAPPPSKKPRLSLDPQTLSQSSLKPCSVNLQGNGTLSSPHSLKENHEDPFKHDHENVSQSSSLVLPRKIFASQIYGKIFSRISDQAPPTDDIDSVSPAEIIQSGTSTTRVTVPSTIVPTKPQSSSLKKHVLKTKENMGIGSVTPAKMIHSETIITGATVPNTTKQAARPRSSLPKKHALKTKRLANRNIDDLASPTRIIQSTTSNTEVTVPSCRITPAKFLSSSLKKHVPKITGNIAVIDLVSPTKVQKTRSAVGTDTVPAKTKISRSEDSQVAAIEYSSNISSAIDLVTPAKKRILTAPKKTTSESSSTQEDRHETPENIVVDVVSIAAEPTAITSKETKSEQSSTQEERQKTAKNIVVDVVPVAANPTATSSNEITSELTSTQEERQETEENIVVDVVSIAAEPTASTSKETKSELSSTKEERQKTAKNIVVDVVLVAANPTATSSNETPSELTSTLEEKQETEDNIVVDVVSIAAEPTASTSKETKSELSSTQQERQKTAKNIVVDVVSIAAELTASTSRWTTSELTSTQEERQKTEENIVVDVVSIPAELTASTSKWTTSELTSTHEERQETEENIVVDVVSQASKQTASGPVEIAPETPQATTGLSSSEINILDDLNRLLLPYMREDADSGPSLASKKATSTIEVSVAMEEALKSLYTKANFTLDEKVPLVSHSTKLVNTHVIKQPVGTIMVCMKVSMIAQPSSYTIIIQGLDNVHIPNAVKEKIRKKVEKLYLEILAPLRGLGPFKLWAVIPPELQ